LRFGRRRDPTLAAAGVKRIYGIVGDSLNGLTDAIRLQGKIEWVHVRHEEVAAFASGAEARLTGELAMRREPRTRSPLRGLLRFSRRRRSRILLTAYALPDDGPQALDTQYFRSKSP
jgi:hypothetical protein